MSDVIGASTEDEGAEVGEDVPGDADELRFVPGGLGYGLAEDGISEEDVMST